MYGLKLKAFEIQGHRGARGLYPENTIPAFIEAVNHGAHTLEMDVVVSKDNSIVVSHEPWMSEIICAGPNGKELQKNSAQQYNLYNMNYAEIKLFDCGMRENPEFPLQKKIPAHKPLLSQVIYEVESHIKRNKLASVNYNIEIKSEAEHVTIFYPEPAAYVQLLYTELKKLNLLSKVILQSFDVQIMNEINKTDPDIITSLLVENSESLQANLGKLNFTPSIYGPDFNFVTEEMIKELHAKKIKLIPWTVNEEKDVMRLFEWGADGIISDYPDRAMKILGPLMRK
jgi:glycerophosphoryl diester phosphodiesterase